MSAQHITRSSELSPTCLNCLREWRIIWGKNGRELERTAYYVNNFLFPDDIRGLRLLDVGGGDGKVGLYLYLARGAKVNILDEFTGHGSPAANREKLFVALQQLGISDIRVIQTDVRQAEIPSASYDRIYTRNCLHHIFDSRTSSETDVAQTMELFYQWLVPGGVLVIGEVGWLLAYRLIPPIRRLLFPMMEYKSKTSFRRWRRCAQMAGFEFLGVRWYVPYSLRKWRGLLGNEWANPFLTGAYVLQMKKQQGR